VLLDDLVKTSEAVAATSSRRAKIEAIASLLRAADAAEVPVAVAFLSGELRQRQIGVGYAALRDILAESAGPGSGVRDKEAGPGHLAPGGARPPGTELTLTTVDSVFAQIGEATGAGSQARRRELLGALFSGASGAQRSFLFRLLAGDLHQGALEGVMVEAIAAAAGVAADEVRRAHLLGGSLLAVAQAALAPPVGGSGPDGALAALRGFGLRVGRPLQPMLAAAADSIGAAFERICPAAVEWKIDGIRVQVHKNGPGVAVFTRTLDDITARVPEVVAAVAALPAACAVLDGELIALGPAGRPLPFQVTAGRTGSRSDVARLAHEVPLTVFFFDLLHLDGTDLLDEPGAQRFARLTTAVGTDLLIPRTVTADVLAAEAFFGDAVARGHEGVVVKSLDASYAAGRRGTGWIKVKPRHTLDLVVLAAEWGHGRRRGLLSNLHLGARDPAGGGNVMLGKTFKGLTDEVLTWQTGRLLDLADPPPSGPPPSGPPDAPFGVVRVRPELVVEIAFDGVQASRRYPGGLALRFARVVRYRPDKRAADADTIDDIRRIAASAGVVPDAAAGLAPARRGGKNDAMSEGAGEVLDPVDEV
jgi:ATP-dependent DNA ligase I